jgi:hypothetical protein
MDANANRAEDAYARLLNPNSRVSKLAYDAEFNLSPNSTEHFGEDVWTMAN